jgi:L-fuconate dehydratase
MEGRVTEFVDHLHEHFLDPVRVVNGRYMLPQRAGYSIEIYAETLARFAFPFGAEWAG